MIRISVPATSANLGIGYDTLGMAVSLYSHFTFERADELTITGCPEEFRNANNLVYVSLVDALAEWGEEPFGVSIDIQTEVPVARGLGSSSTCVVAGIMAAAALTGHTVTREELVAMATRVEGHPDNVAPAILGAAVCSFTPDGRLPRCLRYDVSDRLRFVTVIPPYEVHTSEARKVVPQEVPLSTAVWQMGRVAGLTRGLETGDASLIADANDDRLQEPYRRALIPDYNAIRETCLAGGAKTMWISGSGSTLMAVTDDTIVAKFLQVRLKERFPECETHILTCDTCGAQIEYL
ncbi:MAG: homoserine kinase [Parolsenella sp.]|uniref:homoserine kinase n=1 Tax=unclassified Parolsenella TaxID=2623992 RepID=UPI002A755484|nr:homoserine kinase [Parolsenella sp.]MCI5950441.1 homoserine kinase [Coriobacteriaceae bacterium]MDY3291628.1 homoserine kinase [Parolsenella sp.]